MYHIIIILYHMLWRCIVCYINHEWAQVLVSGLETTRFYSILLPPFSLSDREGQQLHRPLELHGKKGHISIEENISDKYACI